MLFSATTFEVMLLSQQITGIVHWQSKQQKQPRPQADSNQEPPDQQENRDLPGICPAGSEYTGVREAAPGGAREQGRWLPSEQDWKATAGAQWPDVRSVPWR